MLLIHGKNKENRKGDKEPDVYEEEAKPPPPSVAGQLCLCISMNQVRELWKRRKERKRRRRRTRKTRRRRRRGRRRKRRRRRLGSNSTWDYLVFFTSYLAICPSVYLSIWLSVCTPVNKPDQ